MLDSHNQSVNDTKSHAKWMAEVNLQATIHLAPTIAYFIFIMLVGLVGNSLVFVVFYLKFAPSRTRSNILVLCTCDILSITLILPADIFRIRFYYGIMHATVLCNLLSAISRFLTTVAAAVLVAIAFERYWKLCQSTSKRQFSISVSRCVFVILGILVAAPVFMFKQKPEHIEGTQLCHIRCYVGFTGAASKSLYSYNIFKGLVFFGCAAIMLVSYVLIARRLLLHKKHTRSVCLTRHVTAGSILQAAATPSQDESGLKCVGDASVSSTEQDTCSTLCRPSVTFNTPVVLGSRPLSSTVKTELDCRNGEEQTYSRDQPRKTDCPKAGQNQRDKTCCAKAVQDQLDALNCPMSEQNRPDNTDCPKSELDHPGQTDRPKTEQSQPGKTTCPEAEQDQQDKTAYPKAGQIQPGKTACPEAEQDQPGKTAWPEAEQDQPGKTDCSTAEEENGGKRESDAGLLALICHQLEPNPETQSVGLSNVKFSAELIAAKHLRTTLAPAQTTSDPPDETTLRPLANGIGSSPVQVVISLPAQDASSPSEQVTLSPPGQKTLSPPSRDTIGLPRKALSEPRRRSTNVSTIARFLSSLRPNGCSCPPQTARPKTDQSHSGTQANTCPSVKKIPASTSWMFSVVTIVFIVSFLPHVIVHSIFTSFPNPNPGNRLQVNFYHIAIRSFHISSFANPIVYGFLSPQFRRECRKLIAKCRQRISRFFSPRK